ncbi:hypothetical protein H6G36_10350 [Anabaena minutissima FACHB-250]|uniref:hypothetical protein n=1 Tax=Anabaena sp. CCY 9402-a TaxID=3103867 RepID=UPI00168859DA|nr:hypothetical protein [Anabaena minutissima FACHB-250]
MTNCPCCSSLLLRHIRNSQVHWFCRHCWQDMPVFYRETPGSLVDILVSNFSYSFDQQQSDQRVMSAES